MGDFACYCQSVLHRYLAKHPRIRKALGLSVPDRGGADQDGSVAVNPRNWVSLSTVIRHIKSFQKTERYSLCSTVVGLNPLESARFKAPSKVSMYVLLHDDHMYSALFLPGERCYVVDGANLILERPAVHEFISAYFKTEIAALRSGRIVRADHCAGAAVGLCLELSREFLSGGLCPGGTLHISDTIVNRLIPSLCPEPSVSVLEPTKRKLSDLSLASRKRCKKCDLVSSFSKMKLLAHERKCEGV